jgi:thiol-disulfide isomerase/thioredoxin
MMYRPTAFLFCSLLVTLVGCGRQDIRLKILDYEGLEKLISLQRGKVVVLDAWSTGCPPCVREFPDLVAMHRRIGPDRLACISLSFDYEGIGKPEDQAPPVLAFLRSQGATFENVLASEEPVAFYKKLEIPSVPAVFVYDRQGKLRERFQDDSSHANGKPLYERVESLVNELLAEK